MDHPFDVSANRCQAGRGLILVTSCQGETVARCGRCGIRLCFEHAVQARGTILCPACAATNDQVVSSEEGRPIDTAADEPLAPPETTGPVSDDDLFTPEDYAAFDGAGDADMNAGVSDGFDS